MATDRADGNIANVDNLITCLKEEIIPNSVKFTELSQKISKLSRNFEEQIVDMEELDDNAQLGNILKDKPENDST